MSDLPTAEELISVDRRPPGKDWMDIPAEVRKGFACYAANPKSLETLSAPNPRAWSCFDDDWQLPENWQEIIHQGFKERLEKIRAF